MAQPSLANASQDGSVLMRLRDCQQRPDLLAQRGVLRFHWSFSLPAGIPLTSLLSNSA
jgi:hypothetical protein